MDYEVIIKPAAQKDLDPLPGTEVERILFRIENLSLNPRPFGVQKLNNEEGYRIRSGNYRVLFEIDEKRKIVSVYKIKHRKDVYRN